VYGIRATRIDAALDFYGYSGLLKSVERAAKRGNYSGVLKYSPKSCYEWVKGAFQLTGITHYFGSSTSDKLVRIYDKALESNGKKNCVRWEVQFRRDYAHQLFCDFTTITGVDTDELLLSFLAGSVLGSIRFVNRRSGDRLSRQEELKWYQELQQTIALAIPVSVFRKESKIRQSMAYIEKQFGIRLNMIRNALGRSAFNNWINSVCNRSERRLTPHHRMIRDVWMAEIAA
jgi:DNA relaxase NicK